HDDIGGDIIVRFLQQGAAVGVGQNQTNLLGPHDTEHVEQVADVEPDFQTRTVVIDNDLFLGLFLLRVICLDLQQACSQGQANAAVLLVGKDRGTAEGFTQALAVRQYQLVAAARQNTLVVREFAVDQLGGEGKLTGVGADVM